MSDLTPEEIERIASVMGNSGSGEPIKVADKPTWQEVEKSTQQKMPTLQRAQFMQLDDSVDTSSLPVEDMSKLYDIKVKVEVVLGQTRMSLEEILKLHPGSCVELRKLAGEPVDVFANGRLIARAEVVVIENTFGIKILEIAGTKQKLRSIAPV